ncbi:MAG: pilus assembly protein PilM [Planctomycetes bacterium]|nr:pilus assembly protein PilM [Planctomycetota bacterium]
MAKRATAVDIGSHSAKVLVAQVGKHGVSVLRFAGLPTGEAPGDVDLRGAGIPLKDATCGLAGRDMTLRYSQVPPTPDWQLRNLMDLEIQDLAQQSGGALSADYNLLPIGDEESGVDTVLLALAKDDALERQQKELAAAAGSVAAFVPNCTALYNAFLKAGPVEADAVVALVNIGHQTIDLAIVRGTDLLFARNLTSGTKGLDDAIASSFNVSSRKAEALKKDLLDLDPQSRGNYQSGQAEKVTMAAMAAASSIPAAIQSSLSFCKAQTKIADLRLDKVLLCGGGARLRGLRGLLRENLRCPVELFDPFANVDLSALPPDDAEQLQQMRHESVVALGLAVGRLDDTLYALEILPEAVRKKQRFQQRTIWNIAAGAVVVGVIGLQVSFGQQRVAAIDAAAKQMRVQVSRFKSIDSRAEALAEENEKARVLVAHLQKRALPLHGALRTMRAIEAHLPEQLWLDKFEVTAARRGQDVTPRAVFLVRGKALNGVDAGNVMAQFYSEFKADPDLSRGVEAVMAGKTTQDTTQLVEITVDLTVVPPEAAPAEDAKEGK